MPYSDNWFVRRTLVPRAQDREFQLLPFFSKNEDLVLQSQDQQNRHRWRNRSLSELYLRASSKPKALRSRCPAACAKSLTAAVDVGSSTLRFVVTDRIYCYFQTKIGDGLGIVEINVPNEKVTANVRGVSKMTTAQGEIDFISSSIGKIGLNCLVHLGVTHKPGNTKREFSSPKFSETIRLTLPCSINSLAVWSRGHRTTGRSS